MQSVHESTIRFAKAVILKHKPKEKILKDDFRKLLIKEGSSSAKSYEAIFILTALDLIKEDKPYLILDKKLFEAGK